MTTYEENRSLHDDSKLRNKVTTAVVIAAQAQLVADPGSANGRKWALKALSAPAQWGDIVFKAVLAANKDNTVAQIEGATDVAIQASVDAVIPGIIAADAGV